MLLLKHKWQFYIQYEVGMKKYVLYLFFTMLFVSACSNPKKDERTSITTSELKKELTDKNLVVLDVRTDAEIAGPMKIINNAVHIPIDQLEARLNELDKYKDKKIAVICKSGIRSARGTNILIKYGFNAMNVDGGMLAYTETK